MSRISSYLQQLHLRSLSLDGVVVVFFTILKTNRLFVNSMAL